MSKTAIQFLLDNLEQLVNNNADLISKVGEVESLRSDLQVLKAFLEDSTEESKLQNLLKGLVTEIRDLTCEVEDAIDTCVVEVTFPEAKKWLRKRFHGFDLTKKVGDVAKKVQTTREKVEQMYSFALQRRDPAGRSRMQRRHPDYEEDYMAYSTTKLINTLIGGTEDLQVISIIGMAGLGKTYLAKNVYNDPRVSDEFSIVAWIYVSETYSKKDLFLSILKCVTQVTITKMCDMDEDSLKAEVHHYLTFKYLVVVDDVWKKKDWDDIKMAFPDHKNGSRILLTSRNKQVAPHDDPHSQHYQLEFLTHPQSWKLLQKMVFGQQRCPENLMDVGIQIATQCAGVPLALVVIAEMLLTNTSKGSWETIAKSIRQFLVQNERDLKEVLALSYHHLPPHLKVCFLYFGVFPKQYEIPVWILIRLWIAEGFVEKIENICLEEMAEQQLEDLVARNLVLVVKRTISGRIKTCRIYDMFRNLCLSEAQAENFSLESKGLGINSSSHLYPNVSIVNRRLSIHYGVLKYISSKPSSPRVRSFLCFTKDQVDLTPKQVGYISKEFKLLRVLHIEPIRSHMFPSKIEQLALLRYVAISGDFTNIPAAVSNLRNLETLIAVTSSHTIDIQADISKMLHLRHLHTNVASKLHGPVVRHADTFLKNEALQTLYTITPDSCTKGVLDQIPHIKKLGIRGNLSTLLEDNRLHSFDDLTKLEQLVTLKLLNVAFPQLRGLPDSYKFPPNLKRLTLAGTFLSWEYMSVLGKLSKLEELKLKDNAFTGVHWILQDNGFKELNTLQIWKTDLVYWEAEDDHFPSLQHIFLRDCMKLQEIPNLSTLRTIKLYQTSHSAAASARKIRLHQRDFKAYDVVKVDIFPLESRSLTRLISRLVKI